MTAVIRADLFLSFMWFQLINFSEFSKVINYFTLMLYICQEEIVARVPCKNRITIFPLKVFSLYELPIYLLYIIKLELFYQFRGSRQYSLLPLCYQGMQVPVEQVAGNCYLSCYLFITEMEGKLLCFMNIFLAGLSLKKPLYCVIHKE